MVFPIRLVSEGVYWIKQRDMICVDEYYRISSVWVYKSSLLVCLKELDTKHLLLDLCPPVFQVFWLTLELRDNLVLPPLNAVLSESYALPNKYWEMSLFKTFFHAVYLYHNVGALSLVPWWVRYGNWEGRVCEVSWLHDPNHRDGLNVICPRWNSHGNLLIGASVLGEGDFSKYECISHESTLVLTGLLGFINAGCYQVYVSFLVSMHSSVPLLHVLLWDAIYLVVLQREALYQMLSNLNILAFRNVT